MKTIRSKLVLTLITGAAAAGVWFICLQAGLFSTGQSAAEAGSIKQMHTESIELGKGLTMELVLIQPGSFAMGSPQEVGDEDEGPVHDVTLTRPFYMGQYEVTQEQWEAVMGGNPSKFKGATRPVDSVSWQDCQDFLKKLQNMTGKEFALPSEAQWEYVARAGTITPWSFGDKGEAAQNYAWVDSNSGRSTHPVGEKMPNPWGIYDMYGNVQEWTADWYGNPYPTGDAVDPAGPLSGDARVLRGGAWGDDPANTRSSYRNCMGTEEKHEGAGLRVVIL